MNWPGRARTAALDLSTGDERQDDSVTALVIRDIHDAFDVKGLERIKTADLLAVLHEIEESPWGDWNGGKGLSAHGLSRLLRPYRIKTLSVKVDGETVRGYKLEQFADAFARSSVTSVTSVTSGMATGLGSNASNASNASGREEGENGKRLLPGDPGYLEFLFAAFDAGNVTADEWHHAERIHQQIVATRKT